jgi:hypothetical protein
LHGLLRTRQSRHPQVNNRRTACCMSGMARKPRRRSIVAQSHLNSTPGGPEICSLSWYCAFDCSRAKPEAVLAHLEAENRLQTLFSCVAHAHAPSTAQFSHRFANRICSTMRMGSWSRAGARTVCLLCAATTTDSTSGCRLRRVLPCCSTSAVTTGRARQGTFSALPLKEALPSSDPRAPLLGYHNRAPRACTASACRAAGSSSFSAFSLAYVLLQLTLSQSFQRCLSYFLSAASTSLFASTPSSC